MVTLNRTLIIFDTNSLRNVLRNGKGSDDQVIYHFFEFGAPFKTIESFIADKHLADNVELAIPRIALDELKKQKMRSYHSDINIFTQIHSLLTQIPFTNKDKIQLPDLTFNYREFIEENSINYLKTKKIRIIELPDDDHLKASFHRIINKALNTQPPFRKHGEKSDVGFKDALIWESILSYQEITNFDKIILFTGDNGFSGECTVEFEEKIKRNLSIKKAEGEVTDELMKDYEEYIENYELVKYAHTDYFKDMLLDEMSGRLIRIGTESYPISRIDILDPCLSIETVPDAGDPNIEISKIKAQLHVIYEAKGEKGETPLLVELLLDETKEVVGISFDPELTEP